MSSRQNVRCRVKVTIKPLKTPWLKPLYVAGAVLDEPLDPAGVPSNKR
jgi:hypothetical protein